MTHHDDTAQRVLLDQIRWLTEIVEGMADQVSTPRAQTAMNMIMDCRYSGNPPRLMGLTMPHIRANAAALLLPGASDDGGPR